MISNYIITHDLDYQECHASTLAETSDGTILASWFAGTKEGDCDVAIWGAKYSNGKWEKPVRWAKVNNQPHWNPVLHYSKDETTLFFKVGSRCSHWKTWVMRSTDDGANWTDPVELIPGNTGGRGPVKNKCIELTDGTWLAPGSNEIKSWKAFVDRSEDQGRNWTRTKLIDQPGHFVCKDKNGKDVRFGVIQPSLWESEPGKVHMLLRSTCGRICRSDSCDGGRTWSNVYETGLPNNNSGIDLTKLQDGSLLLAYNPVGKNWGPRCPMTLTRSTDNGLTWKKVTDLETESGREYSYPAVITLKNGGAAVSYTWGRKKIATHILTVAEISAGINA